MPRRTITSENRAGSGGPKFPRLEFKNKGDRHRVLLFQKDEDGQAVVWQEWIHVLRVPKFKDDGMPKMTLKDSKRGDGDEKYEDYDTDWLGTPLCLGDSEVIEREGFDAANCPICAAVPKSPPEAKLAPQLALAANVVEYALASGTWNVQRPLSARVVIWRMSPGTYDEIISQQEQHGELLQQQDLTLEVVNPGFRTVKMGVMAPSGWKETESGGQYLAELLGTPGNIATDDQLRASCGRDAKRLFMEEDLGISLKKWAKAKLALEGPGDFAALPAPDLASGVRELLGQDPAQAAQQVAAMRDQARSEVTKALNPENPFSEFTTGNAQAAAETVHAQAVSTPAATDPFGATTAQAAPTGTAQPAVAASPAAASTQTVPPSDPFGGAAASVPASSSAVAADPFAAAAAQSNAAGLAPTTAASPESPGAPSSAEPVSFEDMISSLQSQGS